MFAILLVALTEEGQSFFTKYLPGGGNTWTQMVYCFEQMLCYWAWLKQHNYWMANDEAALTKLHEMFHVPRDIHRNGKHYNVRSAPQEHNHMAIKAAALKTQRQKHKIDLQTGEHSVDRLILQCAFDRVGETVWNMDQEQIGIKDNGVPITEKHGLVKNATKGCIIITQEKMPNKQSCTPPIRSQIKWNKSQKRQITAPVLSETHLIKAF
jgi:hypothetical protein